jgi:hypothetical protein
MNSCKVIVINEALSRDDVTFAAKPRVQLRAVPLGAMKRQLVKSLSNFDQDIFSVFEMKTNLPADITGMAIFLTISKDDDVVLTSKGKINTDIKGVVSFKVENMDAGFYQYDVSVKAKNYSETLLEGSYVVQP